MAGITLNCPFCGYRCNVRTSERPTLLTVTATLNCSNCGQLKADFVGQITNIKRAVFIDCDEASQWNSTEKEQIQAGKIKAKDNAQRLAELKGEQEDLFKDKSTLPPEKMTPLERMARRASVAQH